MLSIVVPVAIASTTVSWISDADTKNLTRLLEFQRPATLSMMLLWLFLPLASGWWWEGRVEKKNLHEVEKRVMQEEEEVEDYLEEYTGNHALERMDLGEYAYYYYDYPEDRQAGITIPSTSSSSTQQSAPPRWSPEPLGRPDRPPRRPGSHGSCCLRCCQPPPAQTGRHHHRHHQLHLI